MHSAVTHPAALIGFVSPMTPLDVFGSKQGECKTMATPPKGVDDIFAAVVVLLAGVEPNVIVQKSGKVRPENRNWDAAKRALLGNVQSFMDTLGGFKTLVDEFRCVLLAC